MIQVLWESFKYRLMPKPQNALKLYALEENSGLSLQFLEDE